MDKPVTVIEASRRISLIDLKELWLFREVMYFLVWRDFKVRYRQTYLGILWAVLQPLLAMSVFGVFLGRLVGVPSEGVPYPLLILCGLVPWTCFSRSIGGMTVSLVHSQELVKRVYFPRMAIPLAAMFSCLIDMIPGLAVLLLALAVYGIWPSPLIVALPLFVLVMLIATAGIGLTLAAVNVRYRDVGYIVPFAIQLVLFVTPVLYPSSLIPAPWRLPYSLNPMVGVVDGIRWSVLGTGADWRMVAISALCALGLLFLGLFFFSRAEREFPDLI
jgi:lipopolysaccharide transport system permease protein